MKTVLCSIVMLISCHFLSAQNSSNIDSIRSLILSYQYPQAIDKINQQLVNAPQDANMNKLKGLSQKGLLKYSEAIKSFETAMKTDTCNYQLYLETAFCYKYLGNFAKALIYFNQAGNRHPNNITIKNEIAAIHFATENYEKAISIYLEVYVKDTTNIFVIKNIARCYELIEENDSARMFYEKAARINSFDSQTVLRLSNLYIVLNLAPKAIKLSENYIRLDSSYVKINRINAYSYYVAKRYRDAIRKYSRCVQYGDTLRSVLEYLGRSYCTVTNYDSAYKYLRKAFEKDTTDYEVCCLLGVSSYELKYKEESVYYFTKTIQMLTPQPKFYSEVHQRLAMSFNLSKRYKDGLRTYLKALEIDPADTLLLYRIAIQYDEKLKNKKTALKYYKAFMKTRPVKKETQPATEPAKRPAKVLTISYYSAAEIKIKEIEEALQAGTK